MKIADSGALKLEYYVVYVLQRWCSTNVHIVNYFLDLIDIKIDINLPYDTFNSIGHVRTFLHDAALNGKLDIVKHLIQMHNANVEVISSYYRRPLEDAALWGCLNVVTSFRGRSKSANFETRTNRYVFLAYKGRNI